MNEKGKDFISYNKPYMPSAGLHGPLHMVCTLSLLPAPTLALDLHGHTQWHFNRIKRLFSYDITTNTWC